MKARFFVEVEIDNTALALQFGEKLAAVQASGAIELKLAQTVGNAMKDIPHLKDLQVSVLPIALRSDKLS